MKSAKPPAADTPSHRRSQPVRQTRTNPPRSSAALSRAAGGGRDLVGAGALSDQPIDIFPAVTHFADAITALPKELVRHFTLLKEVDAKLFAPEDQLFRLVAAAAKAPLPEPHPSNEASSSIAPASAPMSAQNSSSGIAASNGPHPVPSADDSHKDLIFDPSNLPRRHLYRQTAIKIQEMLVSLEEKNHVISTANEVLQAQLARIDDVWPHLENEFSDETKWGSDNHWAYPENREGRASQAERTRRDGAAAISAAAQALAEEAAARSDARKQAVQAKKNSRNQNNNNHSNNSNNTNAVHDSDFDDHDGRHKGEAKKSQGTKSRKAATAETNNIGLGITTASSTNSGNPPQKRRKVEKTTNGATAERAMSSVFGTTAPKAKTASPRATPAPEGPKKRKALPSGSGQSKKSRNGVTGIPTSATSSPVLTELPEPKSVTQASPVPTATPVPAPTRARQNSMQSANPENGKARPASSASSKPNGTPTVTPDPIAQSIPWPRPTPELKVVKESSAPIKTEPPKEEAERPEVAPVPVPVASKKENKPDENDRKSESVPPVSQTPTVTTKSGRASKPSTPAMATFQEAVRSRSSRVFEGGAGVNKKAQKKAGSTIHAAVGHLVDEDTNSSMQGDEEEGDVDADEPTYCYCNSVSYGEMVACDADGCPREWFHLECVGLKVAPGTKAKWYCSDCKERLKMGSKKVNGR
ncbi:hypothetical protein AK830_g11264 [Neonectria ditissima]|uniref:Chromatin modification-related protein n=1 Tax=Neonectria ditissima TaxID=78410 RepID=A0A0P7ADI4_9HYPO|nr:hypothetical protein AK830_g11264 [Neonectria ditissima]